MGKREAIVAVLRRDDRVLVIQRCWPGSRGIGRRSAGKPGPGEAQEEALIREVHEEVGLAATPLTKVWGSVTYDGQLLAALVDRRNTAWRGDHGPG
jgi:8-oxo-dGTP pyrophosphatase MutT (NUDIX family)